MSSQLSQFTMERARMDVISVDNTSLNLPALKHIRQIHSGVEVQEYLNLLFCNHVIMERDGQQ